MSVCLGDAAYCPAEVAEDLPLSHCLAVNLGAAGAFVGVQELFGRADSAQSQVGLPEAPGTDARPGQVLSWVADVGKLPVEDATQPFGANHQVADAKISVQQDRLVADGRMGFKPAQPQLQ